jgi:crotonobetainyl-CoA:carnitine CoA-transferase CaiB-like acyl-CoA transferase
MELRETANMEEHGVFQTVDHPTRGSDKIPVWPNKASSNDVPLKPPLLGEHNEPALTEWLDMSTDEVAELKTIGVT